MAEAIQARIRACKALFDSLAGAGHDLQQCQELQMRTIVEMVQRSRISFDEVGALLAAAGQLDVPGRLLGQLREELVRKTMNQLVAA